MPTMAHASQSLLEPTAQVIPAAATVHACVVEVQRSHPAAIRRPLGEDDGNGFDLRHFNIFATETYEQVNMLELDHTRLTAVFDAWDFDLTGGAAA